MCSEWIEQFAEEVGAVITEFEIEEDDDWTGEVSGTPFDAIWTAPIDYSNYEFNHE